MLSVVTFQEKPAIGNPSTACTEARICSRPTPRRRSAPSRCRCSQEYAPDARTFRAALGLPSDQIGLAETIRSRVVEKLTREPVEDFRIDFEDGYGIRPDRRRGWPRAVGRGGSRLRARGGHAAAFHRHPHQADVEGTARAQPPDARSVRDDAGARGSKASSAELRRDDSEADGAGPCVRRRARLRGTRAGAEAAAGSARARAHDRNAAIDSCRRRFVIASCARGRGQGARQGRALRHLRLHGALRHHRVVAAHAPRGVRLRQAHDAGRPRAGRRLALGRRDQHHADPAAPRPFPIARSRTPSAAKTATSSIARGSCTSTTRSTPSSTGSTRGGICIRRSCRRAMPRSTPSFSRRGRPQRQGSGTLSTKRLEATLVGDVFDDAATGQGLLNFFVRGLSSGALTLEEARETGSDERGAAGAIISQNPGGS